MADVNYRPLVLMRLEEFAKKHPNYSLSEIFYCMLTHQSEEIEINKKSDLLKITDKQLYAGLDRAFIKEEE